MSESLPFATRFWFAFACFFRTLFDAEFAGRAWSVRDSSKELAPAKLESKERDLTPALQLLALFQREGRLVDFLKQDVSGFSDQDVGMAARAVHEGCRKALATHATITPVRTEDEGSSVTLEAGFDASRIKLTGNVSGQGPYGGTLRHKGWQATKLTLPVAVDGHDTSVLAPAEVEL